MSDILDKLFDSLSPVPTEEPKVEEKSALEKLWDKLSGNRPSQSPSKQRSEGKVGDGINKEGKPLQGARNGPAGQMTFDQVFENLITTESGGKHLDEKGKLVKSKVGAEGITQLMPTTAKKPGFGITPVKDKSEDEYKRVGKEYLQALHTRFEGDWEKALSAYNWGVGNVNKAIGKAERFGGDWKESLPEETRNYLERILRKEDGKKR